MMNNEELLFENNIKLLFENNNVRRKIAKNNIKNLKRNKWIFSSNNSVINLDYINTMIGALKYAIVTEKLPISIDIQKSVFSDKLAMKIFECVLYYVIKCFPVKIEVKLEVNDSLTTKCIQYSPILKASDTEEYLYFFADDQVSKSFRRIISYNENRNGIVSYKSSEILRFLTSNGIDEDTTDYISIMIGELIDNAITHGKSDCFLDIDLSDNLVVDANNTNKLYYIINIVVLNFSKTPLYSKLKYKLNDTSKWANGSEERYNRVLAAKNYHLKNLHNNYSENDFYIISSFQDEISGEETKGADGGTGLTCLIQEIEERSTDNICYVLTENRKLYFEKDLLNRDDKRFIGFNEQNDFFENIPQNDIFEKTSMNFPGVAYNLSFLLDKEDIINAEND